MWDSVTHYGWHLSLFALAFFPGHGLFFCFFTYLALFKYYSQEVYLLFKSSACNQAALQEIGPSFSAITYSLVGEQSLFLTERGSVKWRPCRQPSQDSQGSWLKDKSCGDPWWEVKRGPSSFLIPQALSNSGENKTPKPGLCGEVLQCPSLDWQEHGSLTGTQTIVDLVEQNLPISPY